MRLVFMGTPDIAAASLTALLQAGHVVAGVFTREDKPVGRRQVLTPPPVKLVAQQNGIQVYQPRSLRDGAALRVMEQLAPELIVVVAYGRILPPEILAAPKHGCINLHVSLLPKYRGAAPIQWAVINGEEQTGVSIMQMDEGVDTGDVLAQRVLQIEPEQTSGEVFEMVSAVGARLLTETVEDIAAGRAKATPQQGEPSAAPMLDKEIARLDFARPAAQLHNLIRGCNPWPLAWFEREGQRVKVLRAKLQQARGAPGEVLSASPLVVGCGAGALLLEEVVPQGSRAMTGAEWAAGRRLKAGDSATGEA